jgi:hypothetical protein
VSRSRSDRRSGRVDEDPFRLRGRPRSEIEQIEERIDVAEAQLEGMREVWSSILWKGLPTVGFVGLISFGAMGWSLTDPLPVAVGGILLSALALVGVGSRFGIRRGERRLEELDEELALSVRREGQEIDDGGDR